MFKRITALLLGAAIMAASSSVAFAESVPQVQTVTVEQELGASAAKTWDGKSALEAGKSYVLKKSVTISTKVEIPKGTTLTLNKGVKLGISAKGSLYIRGKLAMKAGSTLSVSGKLYTYSGSTISDSGAIKLNTNKAVVTIGGRLTVNKTGTISGVPKSIKLGKNGKVVINGKNTCAKLKALLNSGNSSLEQDKKAIGDMLTKVYETMLVDGDYYGAMQQALPEQVMKNAEEQFKAMVAEYDYSGELAGMTFKDFMNEMYNSLFKPVLDEVGVFKSVKLTVVKLTDYLKDMTDDEKAMFAGSGDITKAYIAEIKGDAEIKENPNSSVSFLSTETAEVKVVYINGAWYFLGSDYDFNNIF